MMKARLQARDFHQAEDAWERIGMARNKSGSLIGNLILASTALAVSACTSPIKEDGYKYKASDSGVVVAFNMKTNEVDNGHRVFGFEPCSDHVYRVCFSGEITLAIPKGHLKQDDEWDVAKTKFSVDSVTRGDDANLEYRILAHSKDATLEILFREDRGIWGLRLLPNGELFEAEEFCGLGCSKQ